MKIAATAVSLAVLATVSVAAPAFASDGPQVRIRHAAARMVVIVEDRTDVAVEIDQGSSALPRPTVTRHGDEIRIDGELGRNSIRNCRSTSGPARQPGDGASVEVRGKGMMQLSATPLIVVRTPRAVRVNVEEGSAVFGAVGRGASSIELGNVGCGDWTLANTDGGVDISLAGSGDIWAGSSASMEISIAGSGDVSTGATRDLDVSIAGSGDVTAARVDGPVDVSTAGSGDVTVRGGTVGALSVAIAGSGDVYVPTRVASVEASLVGAGDVHVQSVAGSIEQSVLGAGRVIIGR